MVSANNPLVFIDSKQQCGAATVAWLSCDNPRVSEELAKESFFDSTGGGNGCRQSQLLGSIGSVPNDG
jgi:hypothetical protein